MKLKYIFTALAAVFALFTSCSDDEMAQLGSVQVSQSYVAIPAEGGSVSVKVRAVADWQITDIPEWLTLSTESGAAGETVVTFTAGAATSTNTATVLLECNGETQRINVLQQTEKVELPVSKAKDVLNGVDGVTYRVKGVVTNLTNKLYGNYDVVDETGSVYIYGTLDASGAEQNFASLGIEAGDIVTVEGPRATYGSTIELVNVTVIAIEKSLIKLDSLSTSTIEKEGGELVAYLTCKGEGVSVESPASWLTVKSVKTFGQNAEVTFSVAANVGGDRKSTITFVTTSNGKEYTATADFMQKGAIIAANVSEFLAAPVGDSQYRVTGLVSKIHEKYNNNFWIQDATGEMYAYRVDAQGKTLTVGDFVTLVGKRGDFKGDAQMTEAVLEKHSAIQAVSVADFLTKSDSNDIYYELTGEITSIAKEEYGNIYLKDASGETYVYGILPGYGAVGDAKKGMIAAKGIKVGDTITLRGNKGSHKGSPQMVNAVYVSHTSK